LLLEAQCDFEFFSSCLLYHNVESQRAIWEVHQRHYLTPSGINDDLIIFS